MYIEEMARSELGVPLEQGAPSLAVLSSRRVLRSLPLGSPTFARGYSNLRGLEELLGRKTAEDE